MTQKIVCWQKLTKKSKNAYKRRCCNSSPNTNQTFIFTDKICIIRKFRKFPTQTNHQKWQKA
jgi:hypothetical protein